MANNVTNQGEQRPRRPSPTVPRAEFTQLLDQALANERQRWRREYVRLGLGLLLLLAVVISGSGWITHRLLVRLRAEQQTLEQGLRVLLERFGTETYPVPFATDTGETPPSALRPTSAQAQADIQRLLTDLEAKTRPLAELLASGDAQTKELLKRRENELRELHQHLDEVQRQLLKAVEPEAAPMGIRQQADPPRWKITATNRAARTPTNTLTPQTPLPVP
ncbi:MAG: hypothetical protein HYV36_02655 [Lentisphaerae bacterium]|nr:hypothetical protein [Lentisphaerota bacterium]